jgi:hypothetical protein
MKPLQAVSRYHLTQFNGDMNMNTLKVNVANNSEIGAIGRVEKIVRTVIGFSGLLAVIVGVAITPLQYFALSVLGIYLIHSVIIGLDPFYAVAHYLRAAVAPKLPNPSYHPQGNH